MDPIDLALEPKILDKHLEKLRHGTAIAPSTSALLTAFLKRCVITDHTTRMVAMTKFTMPHGPTPLVDTLFASMSPLFSNNIPRQAPTYGSSKRQSHSESETDKSAVLLKQLNIIRSLIGSETITLTPDNKRDSARQYFHELISQVVLALDLTLLEMQDIVHPILHPLLVASLSKRLLRSDLSELYPTIHRGLTRLLLRALLEGGTSPLADMLVTSIPDALERVQSLCQQHDLEYKAFDINPTVNDCTVSMYQAAFDIGEWHLFCDRYVAALPYFKQAQSIYELLESRLDGVFAVKHKTGKRYSLERLIGFESVCSMYSHDCDGDGDSDGDTHRCNTSDPSCIGNQRTVQRYMSTSRMMEWVTRGTPELEAKMLTELLHDTHGTVYPSHIRRELASLLMEHDRHLAHAKVRVTLAFLELVKPHSKRHDELEAEFLQHGNKIPSVGLLLGPITNSVQSVRSIVQFAMSSADTVVDLLQGSMYQTRRTDVLRYVHRLAASAILIDSQVLLKLKQWTHFSETDLWVHEDGILDAQTRAVASSISELLSGWPDIAKVQQESASSVASTTDGCGPASNWRIEWVIHKLAPCRSLRASREAAGWPHGVDDARLLQEWQRELTENDIQTIDHAQQTDWAAINRTTLLLEVENAISHWIVSFNSQAAMHRVLNRWSFEELERFASVLTGISTVLTSICGPLLVPRNIPTVIGQAIAAQRRGYTSHSFCLKPSLVQSTRRAPFSSAFRRMYSTARDSRNIFALTAQVCGLLHLAFQTRHSISTMSKVDDVANRSYAGALTSFSKVLARPEIMFATSDDNCLTPIRTEPVKFASPIALGNSNESAFFSLSRRLSSVCSLYSLPSITDTESDASGCITPTLRHNSDVLMTHTPRASTTSTTGDTKMSIASAGASSADNHTCIREELGSTDTRSKSGKPLYSSALMHGSALLHAGRPCESLRSFAGGILTMMHQPNGRSMVASLLAGPGFVSQMITALMAVGETVHAMLFRQMQPGEVFTSNHIELLSFRSDAHDPTLFQYIWNVELLEILIHIHSHSPSSAAFSVALQAMSNPSLSPHNAASVRALFIERTKERYLWHFLCSFIDYEPCDMLISSSSC
jgi:hypothetical protein